MELRKKKIATCKSLIGQEETFLFDWNDPVTEKEIISFENESGWKLPIEYKKFLLVSDGAIIYRTLGEDDGYRLLGINEIVDYTNELKSYGYEFKNSWLCFLQCLFSADIMLFDTLRKNHYIIDGDVGYPEADWEYLNGNFRDFIINLYQCNGAMYWRW